MEEKLIKEIEEILGTNPDVDEVLDKEVYKKYEEFKEVMDDKIEAAMKEISREIEPLGMSVVLREYSPSDQIGPSPKLKKIYARLNNETPLGYDYFNNLIRKYSFRRKYLQVINIEPNEIKDPSIIDFFEFANNNISIDIERSHRKNSTYGKWVIVTNIFTHTTRGMGRENPMIQLITKLVYKYLGLEDYTNKRTRKLFGRYYDKMLDKVNGGHLDEKLVRLIKLSGM